MDFFYYKTLLFVLFFLHSDFEFIKKIDKKTDFIVLDNLGFLYLHENYNLYKYSNNGNLINNYTNLSYGKLSVFDASDPYMLLLYYQDINRIIFLDNQLAPIGAPINLDEFELYQVNKVCKSKEFAIWIYDDFDKRLIQYGFNPKGVLNEINLNLLNIPDEISFIRESGRYLYLNTNKQLYIFDIYGTFIKKVNINIPGSFQISNNKIIYSYNNKLFIYYPEVDKTDTLNIDFTKNIKNMLLNNEWLYVQKKEHVLIYKNN
jgi:hypothetical protein